ncbi:MAG: DUF2934 domain-containing protein [Chlorobiaceae bacterium]
MSNETIHILQHNVALHSEEKIRLAAFHRYIAKGENHGSDMQDWHDAEAHSKANLLNDRIEELCRAYSFADGHTF